MKQAEPMFARIARIENAERIRRERTAEKHHRPVRARPTEDMTASLQDIGDELGVTRERARQLEAKALWRLCSEAHRRAVEHELDKAIDEWKVAKRSGVAKRMYWAIHNVDALLDALAWLDELKNGTLQEQLRAAEQRQDEPTMYVATVSYMDALMPAPKSGKWTSYALTAPRRK